MAAEGLSQERGTTFKLTITEEVSFSWALTCAEKEVWFPYDWVHQFHVSGRSSSFFRCDPYAWTISPLKGKEPLKVNRMALACLTSGSSIAWM